MYFKALRLSFVLCLATAVSSGCGTLTNDPRARTPGTILDDEVLENLVAREIRKADAGFKGSHLVVVSYNGVVLLVGQIAEDRLLPVATDTASKVAKVRRVHNELEVSAPISMVARSNDSWLTTKVKSRLVAAKTVPGTKIKVVTENGVVYLLGLVSREAADNAVEIARTVYGVQKIVKVFEYLDA